MEGKPGNSRGIKEETEEGKTWVTISDICDAPQQTREQVVQAYFEVWTVEVGIWVKNNLSVDFEIFVFTYFDMFFNTSMSFLTNFQTFPPQKKNYKICIFCSLSYPKL